MKTLFWCCVALAGYLAVNTAQYQIEEAAEREALAPPPLEVERPRFAPQTDPIKPPRCPRVDAQGMPLRRAIAVQSDGGEWTHQCTYGIET